MLGNKDFGLKRRTHSQQEIDDNLRAIAKRLSQLEGQRNDINKELRDLRVSQEYWMSVDPNQLRLL